MSFVLKLHCPLSPMARCKHFLMPPRAPKKSNRRCSSITFVAIASPSSGLEHNFDGIKTIDAYRKQVPIRDYEGFRPYIDRMLNGQHPILTREKPQVYASTSGTTGKSCCLSPSPSESTRPEPLLAHPDLSGPSHRPRPTAAFPQ